MADQHAMDMRGIFLQWRTHELAANYHGMSIEEFYDPDNLSKAEAMLNAIQDLPVAHLLAASTHYQASCPHKRTVSDIEITVFARSNPNLPSLI